MKLKIVSEDGTHRRTYVINAETGEPVPKVVSIEWKLEAGRKARAMIEVLDVEIDAQLEAELRPLSPRELQARKVERIIDEGLPEVTPEARRNVIDALRNV